MEFDKDSDDWVFEGGAVTCEICNEQMPDGVQHNCSNAFKEKSSDQFVFTCDRCFETF